MITLVQSKKQDPTIKIIVDTNAKGLYTIDKHINTNELNNKTKKNLFFLKYAPSLSINICLLQF